MPLYEYRCGPCDHTFEALVRTAGDVVHCPRCDRVEVDKLLSAPAAARSGNGRAGELPVSDRSAGPSFGCGRPECGAGMCAGLN
jgi:putative FmdB family regulatory protein